MSMFVGVYVNMEDGDTWVSTGDFQDGSEAFDSMYENNHAIDWFVIPEKQARRLRDRLNEALDEGTRR